jgi:hypothetical protein
MRLKKMSDESMVEDIGSLEAGIVFEHKYIGDLPRISIGNILLEQKIEVN